MLADLPRIVDEGARFNLSPRRFAFNRTLNVPMTALRFLRRQNQNRSTFRVDRVEPSRVVLRFEEEATPRLIGSEDGAPASGSFSIDPRLGPRPPDRVRPGHSTDHGQVYRRVCRAACPEALAARVDGRVVQIPVGCLIDGRAGDRFELPDVPRGDVDVDRQVNGHTSVSVFCCRAQPDRDSGLSYGTSIASGTTVVPQCSTSSAFFPSTIGK